MKLNFTNTAMASLGARCMFVRDATSQPRAAELVYPPSRHTGDMPTHENALSRREYEKASVVKSSRTHKDERTIHATNMTTCPLPRSKSSPPGQSYEMRSTNGRSTVACNILAHLPFTLLGPSPDRRANRTPELAFGCGTSSDCVCIKHPGSSSKHIVNTMT